MRLNHSDGESEGNGDDGDEEGSRGEGEVHHKMTLMTVKSN